VNPTTNEIASALTLAYKLMFAGLTEAYIILGLEWVLAQQRLFFANVRGNFIYNLSAKQIFKWGATFLGSVIS
jgi:hypothetical protein